MKKKLVHYRAFSLPEVIVAMSVLIMVLVASTNLLVSIIRSNRDNMNTLVAYQLAQEGLEGFRNIRDSDWLLGADFQGKIGQSLVWKSSLPAEGEIQAYTLDAQDPDPVTCTDDTDESGIANCAPWQLAALPDHFDEAASDPALTLLYRHQDQTIVRYLHHHDPADQESIFHRYLMISSLPYDAAAHQQKYLKYRVTAVVFWTENGTTHHVPLTTELTDWKGGPL